MEEHKGVKEGNIMGKISNTGRGIARFCWFGNQDGVMRPFENQEFIFENEYHGTYDLDWIVVYEDDKEIARHNPNMVASIFWK